MKCCLFQHTVFPSSGSQRTHGYITLHTLHSRHSAATISNCSKQNQYKYYIGQCQQPQVQSSVAVFNSLYGFSNADKPLCFKLENCTGEIEDESNSYFTARECCVGTENGNSFSIGGECMVDQCKGNVHKR